MLFTPAQRAAAAAFVKAEVDALIQSLVPAMFQGMAHQYETTDLVNRIAGKALDGAASVPAPSVVPKPGPGGIKPAESNP